MNTKPKTNTVESAEDLLGLFVQTFNNQCDNGLLIRAALIADGRVEVRLEAANQKYIFEVVPRLKPMRNLLRLKEELPGKPFLLLCPHIADPFGTDLRSKGIAHADLNGRLFIKTPSFLLDREPKNGTYRNPGTELNPFTLKSSRIVRVLLSHRDEDWTQANLEERTGISRGLVSLTLADLIERELVMQTRAGNRHIAALYRVRDFPRLLEEWSAVDIWRKRVSIQQYSVLAGNLVEIAETVRDALGMDNVLFTQWFAAHLRHPHTTPPLVSAYLKKKPLAELTWGRKVDNGGNLWLLTPKDEGIFQETQRVDGFNLVSDIQIYLDLLPVGQRGPEQAKALQEWEGFGK